MKSVDRVTKALDLLKSLQEILRKENENNWVRGVNAAIQSLESVGENQLEERFEEARSIYRTMSQGVGGFSDFNIWKDDFDDRVEINQRLDELRDELWNIFE